MSSATRSTLDSQGGRLLCAPGDVLAGYEVIGFLASGGTCQLFAARHQVMHREAVIKIQKSSLRADPRRARRMVDEARALALLDHPNVVRIHHADVDERVGVFIVMERLEGRDLRSVLVGLKAARRKVGVEEAIDIVLQIADAVSAFHQAGVLHRDLKPENVFVKLEPGGRRKVKLLDLGIAKLPATRTTEDKVLAGTVSYMAREILVGERASPQSDVFSLAVMLDEMLSGEHPFLPTGPGRAAGMAALTRMTNGDFVPLNARAAEVPAALAQLVARAMSPQPADRPRSMAEFARDLEQVMRAGERAPVRLPATTKLDVSHVDLDATAPLGLRAPLLEMPGLSALAPVDPELGRADADRRERPARQRGSSQHRAASLPSFACELVAPLTMPSLVLIEAPGAWRYMRVPLVVRPDASASGPPTVWLGEGSDIPIPRLPALSVRLVSRFALAVDGPIQPSEARTLGPYDTFVCASYRFQFVPPTPDGLGIPADYESCTVEQSRVLAGPSLLVRSGAVEALMRRFPLHEGVTLIGGHADLDVSLFGCRLAVVARIRVQAGAPFIRVERSAAAEVRLRGARSGEGLLGPGEVLEVEGWEFEVLGR